MSPWGGCGGGRGELSGLTVRGASTVLLLCGVVVEVLVHAPGSICLFVALVQEVQQLQLRRPDVRLLAVMKLGNTQ
jgi:hypothetical protein